MARQPELQTEVAAMIDAATRLLRGEDVSGWSGSAPRG